jgi:single-strand DNA-binding protein
MLGVRGAVGRPTENWVEDQGMNESFVTVVGNVVSDPISRPTKVGRPFASLRIASTTRRWDPEKRAFVDGSTNFLNVVAFNALAANVMTSVKKGHPVVVYGRLRVNQWETEKGEPRTSAEIDAYTIGHDLTRGQVAFTKLARTQLDANDRLADPAIQDALHGDPVEEHDRPEGSGDDEGVVVHGGFGATVQDPTGFGRRIEDADTDEYVVVNGS